MLTDSDFNSRHAFEPGRQPSFCQHTTRLSVRSSRVMAQSGRLVLRSGQLTCPETLRTRLRRQGRRGLGLSFGNVIMIADLIFCRTWHETGCSTLEISTLEISTCLKLFVHNIKLKPSKCYHQSATKNVKHQRLTGNHQK